MNGIESVTQERNEQIEKHGYPDIPSIADGCENEAISIKVSCRRPDYKPDKNALLNEVRLWRLNAEKILRLASDLEKIANEKQ